jgi:hypothetical protein
MDGDEVLFLILSAVLGLAALVRWYAAITRVDPLLSGRRTPALLALSPILCLGGVGVILLNCSDPQVRTAPQYWVPFLMGQAMWLWVPMLLLPVLGISPHSDALGRANLPAAIVCVSAMFATTIVYAAANIGTGPTIWTTIGPAALGTAAMICAWLANRLLSPAWEHVAIGRDFAAAARISALLLAVAVILAPAVAGDWVSVSSTWNDLLRQGWPIAPLAVAAAVVDRFFTPTPRQPRPSVMVAGTAVGACWIAVAALAAAVLR